ncbi:MAG: tetratricopeptide repeat protein, partial [Thiobacillus sp.]
MSFRPYLLSFALLAMTMAGCANTGLKEGRALIAAGQPEAGIARLRQALAETPDNIELKTTYHTQRERLASDWLLQAQGDLDAGRLDAAETVLRRVLEIHPENPRATAQLANLQQARQHARVMETATQDLAAGRLDAAAQTARLVLAQ